MKISFKKLIPGKIFALLTLTLLFGQCTKDETEGVIMVVDAVTNTPIAGATVTMFVDGDEDAGFFLCDYGYVKEQVYTTDTQGKITQCFKEPVLVSLTATWGDAFGGSFSGVGKLNVMKYESTSVTIKLN